MTRQSVWCVAWFHLVATFSLLASCSHPHEVPARKAEEDITLQRKPSRKGMDLVLLIDESGSMYGDKSLTTQSKG